ncbi:MAG: beta-lactamase family protein [Akkermansia sp.]|nr:beta-lactamase family protein [Akkermansia sp.]
MKEQLQAAIDLNVQEGLEQGCAVSVWQDGRELVSLCAGDTGRGSAWAADTLVPIFSATKPAAAACLLQALYDCCQSPELEVGTLWPEFPQPRLTVGQLLAHQSGLAALAEPAPLEDLEACRRAIERSSPLWEPPAHGYHPQTFGPMVDILMLELTGKRVCDFWEERVRRPLELDFYIGHLPQDCWGRVAHLRAPRLPGAMPRTPFYREYFDPTSPVYRAFHSITGFESPREMNTPAAWCCGSPAKGGVASARGLAQFYQALMGQLPGSPFAPDVLEWMRTPLSCGTDRTLLEHTSFSCGAMCEPQWLLGSDGLGHAGAGGSLGLCRPASGLSFAYVMRGMELGYLPGARVQRLLACLS